MSVSTDQIKWKQCYNLFAMVNKRFAFLGISTVFLFVFLFLFFLSNDIENGPVPPRGPDEVYLKAFNGDIQAVCVLRSIGRHGFPHEGDAFVDDGVIHFTFEGGGEKGSMLMTAEEDLYIWMEGSDEGMFLSAGFIKNEGQNFGEGGAFMNTPLSSFFHELNEEGELECREESFEEDLMLPPKNIKFISVAEQFNFN